MKTMTPDEIYISKFDNTSLMNLINLINSLSICIPQTIFIANRIEHKCIYISDNIQKWCDVSPKHFISMNYKAYSEFLRKEEYKRLLEVDKKLHTFLKTLHIKNKPLFTLSYDAHIVTKCNTQMAHLTYSPLSWTENGEIEMYWGVLVLSSQHAFGNIELCLKRPHYKYNYSLEKHQWKRCDRVNINSTEMNIILASAQGISEKEISDTLNISMAGIKSSKQRLFAKLNTKNAIQTLAKLFSLNDN